MASIVVLLAGESVTLTGGLTVFSLRDLITLNAEEGSMGILGEDSSFGFVSATSMQLFWNIPNNIFGISYKLYRDKVLIATLAPKVNTYIDRTAENGYIYLYELETHNSKGLISTVQITVDTRLKVEASSGVVLITGGLTTFSAAHGQWVVESGAGDWLLESGTGSWDLE